MTGTPDVPPEDVPVANLPSIEVDLLQAHDASEFDRLLKACEVYGFFYLNLENYGTMLQDWHIVLDLMKDYFDQPLEVKMRDSRNSDTHGYEAHPGDLLALLNGT
jgi:isopenicillin N synthase-like dioxygenase